MRRFLVEEAREGASVVLPPGESKHALRALRLEAGESIVVFDGRGAEFDARIVRIQSAKVVVAVGAPRAAKAAKRFVIATAVPKGNRLDWMIEKLAEVGAGEILPVRFSRSVASIGDGKRSRLDRIAEAAAKQSGRADLPVIHEETGFDELLPRVIAGCWLASPGGAKPAAGAGMAVIGPEGGMTSEEEQRLIERGAVRVSLGEPILRIETAALVAGGLLANL